MTNLQSALSQTEKKSKQSLKIMTVADLLTRPTFQYSAGSTNQSNKAREENERDTKRKREIKVSLFANDRTFYMRDPKSSTRKFLEPIINFSRI